MKHIMRIDELLSATGKRPDAGKYNVLWGDGRLIYGPKSQDFMQFGIKSPLSMSVDQDERTVSLMPMDDWSDMRIIHRVQNALKDLMKDGAIQGDWNVEIGTKGSVEKSFGSGRVDRIIQYDSQWQKTIPYIFHGTTTEHLDNIMKHGLVPRSSGGGGRNWDKHYTPDSDDQVYLTIDFDRAFYYADWAAAAARKAGSKNVKPVVLEIRDMPVKDLVMDDDFRNNRGIMHLLMSMQGAKDKDTYQSSLRGSGQVANKGIVPPELIYKIHKF